MYDPIVIERRFHGPPGSANGGYACGRLAVMMDGPAEVTLRRPPPLETPLTVEEHDGGLRAVAGGETIIEAVPTTIEPAAPRTVSFAEAEVAARSYPGLVKHIYPTCFVCGPERLPGDGLRIFPGPVEGGGVAAPWIPPDNVADADGFVRPEVVWASLDCPTGWARVVPSPILLGRLAAAQLAPVRAGERYVAAAWPAGEEGRKIFSIGALLGEEGELCGVSRATWIVLKG